MSRSISIAVLLAVIAPSFVIFAGLNTATESKLPACCRRDGKHHCAMMAAAPEASLGTQVKALPPICPFRSSAIPVPHLAAYLPQASLVHFAGLKSHPAIHVQTRAAQRISAARSHQKRGPPLQLPS